MIANSKLAFTHQKLLKILKPSGPVRAWFFEIAFVREVGMCVCVSATEAIN